MIVAMNGLGRLQGIYAQYNTRPVTKIRQISEDERTPQLTEISKRDRSQVAKEKFDGIMNMKYAENNPYESSRKIAEESILSGMNLDIYA